MSGQWPDPRGYWGETPGQGQSQDMGGYQPPPGYHSGGWASQQQPYAAPYQGYATPHGSPYPQPAPPSTNGSTVGALVVAIITMLICSGTNIVGVILAGIALAKNGEPQEAAKLTRYAWISNWIHLSIIALIVVVIVVAIILTA